VHKKQGVDAFGGKIFEQANEKQVRAEKYIGYRI
jgi:hypothetical protein